MGSVILTKSNLGRGIEIVFMINGVYIKVLGKLKIV